MTILFPHWCLCRAKLCLPEEILRPRHLRRLFLGSPFFYCPHHLRPSGLGTQAQRRYRLNETHLTQVACLLTPAFCQSGFLQVYRIWYHSGIFSLVSLEVFGHLNWPAWDDTILVYAPRMDIERCIRIFEVFTSAVKIHLLCVVLIYLCHQDWWLGMINILECLAEQETF